MKTKTFVHVSIGFVLGLALSSIVDSYRWLSPSWSQEEDKLPVAINSNSNESQHEELKVSYALLLTSPNSGSEWTCSELKRMPGVKFHDETESSGFVQRYTVHDVFDKSAVNRIFNTTWKEYHQALIANFPKPDKDTKYVGLKLMYGQIPPQLYKSFAKWLNEEEVLVIHLKRLTTAIQYESQIAKYQRVALEGGRTNYTDHCRKNVGCDRPEIARATFNETVCPGWEMNVLTLEKNHRVFSNYLRVHAFLAPVFEIVYEDMAGPHGRRVLEALGGYMRLENFQLGEIAANAPMKTGKTTCEDRIAGLGDEKSYPALENLTQSRVMCFSLHNKVSNRTESNTNLFLPPKKESPLRYQFFNGMKGLVPCSQHAVGSLSKAHKPNRTSRRLMALYREGIMP